MGLSVCIFVCAGMFANVCVCVLAECTCVVRVFVCIPMRANVCALCAFIRVSVYGSVSIFVDV